MSWNNYYYNGNINVREHVADKEQLVLKFIIVQMPTLCVFNIKFDWQL